MYTCSRILYVCISIYIMNHTFLLVLRRLSCSQLSLSCKTKHVAFALAWTMNGVHMEGNSFHRFPSDDFYIFFYPIGPIV